MSDPGPRPDSATVGSDELAHMEAMQALRTASDEKLAKLTELFTTARIVLAQEAEAELQPHVQHLYDVMEPILDKYAAESQELLALYRQGVAEAREGQEHAARELRMLHQKQQERLEATRSRCQNCNSIIGNAGRCMRCNGQPPPQPPKNPRRERVQS